jgi:hypothetical protein
MKTEQAYINGFVKRASRQNDGRRTDIESARTQQRKS